MSLLSIRGLRKAYGSAPVLREASLELRSGEIHALMGENGAGKSTLIRILAGVTPADAQEVLLDGTPVPLDTPADAQRAGLRFVHQELNIVPTLSVAENVMLGRSSPRRFGALIDWKRLEEQAAEALRRFGAAHIDPRIQAGRLPTGDRMLIRLAALLVAADSPPRFYVLDEPTAALTQREAERLFAILKDLCDRGAGVLYVSHRLDEVMALADRVTVLRDGRTVLAAPMPQVARADIIRAMTGREIPQDEVGRPPSTGTRTVLRLAGATTDRLSDLTLTLQAGEVLGVVGLEGAGQSDLLHLLLGEGRLLHGEAILLGRCLPRTPSEAWARGIAYVPRDRRQQGLMPGRSIVANMVLPHLARLSLAGLSRPRLEMRRTSAMREALRLRCASLSQPVRALSGGNQQKVVLGRAIMAQPRLLLLDEPTRGVDVGAREDIYAAIRSLTRNGAAALLASSDLSEVLSLSDRILVLRGGRQTALVSATGLQRADLLSLIFGEDPEPAAA
ncbi:sugar ABC transporter ATP-binding protein [Rubellimicrobium sp. CFH 75288]|uniref:sugar ABC transporter ATP-binding protein n=1 Tax=Rubellimicrobium sp. CFH 75288 TaxID=2697034 RepID=UPI0014122511|nr:sugar ABC transporter ATP-binding protein [Rubellimicrobium sp. CFH 75288]NAZ35932.1 ATP-binding cassette domain-containing protein [Rubellimicrobium sp. CFH 75288]